MSEQKDYLDFAGLKHFYDKLAETYGTKSEINNLIQQKTFDEWLAIGDKVLDAGTILVYTDRTSVDGEYVPDIKISDGRTSVSNLPFLVERNLSSLIENYISIADDISNEIYLLGASQASNDIKRNTGIKMKNDTITARFFNGVAKSVEHSLTIGDKVYDGSSNVTIPIYEGDIQ